MALRWITVPCLSLVNCPIWRYFVSVCDVDKPRNLKLLLFSYTIVPQNNKRFIKLLDDWLFLLYFNQFSHRFLSLDVCPPYVGKQNHFLEHFDC